MIMILKPWKRDFWQTDEGAGIYMVWIVGTILAGIAGLTAAGMYVAVGRAMDRDTRDSRTSVDDRQ